jgi:hypothetical protein
MKPTSAARRLLLPAVLASALVPGSLSGSTPDAPEAVRFFAPFFFPKVIQDTFRIKEYVCGDEFAVLRAAEGDCAAVDALYAEALDLSWGNTGEALLLCLVATMDHRRVDLTLPVLGFVLPIPLTGEFEAEFVERRNALPSRLYGDSPRTRAGDRDKLQHFFGSAYLVVLSESESSADDVGYFVERGESRFVPGETIDARDIRANRQGQRFGRAILTGLNARPSEFLRVEEARP